MARGTKSNRKKKPTKKARAGASRGLPRVPMRVVARAAGVMALLGVGVGVALAHERIAERVGATRADPLDPPRFHWPVTPSGESTWMPAEERRRLEQIVMATVSRNPLNGESLDDARRALQRTGWFRSLDRVQRRPGGVIEIIGQFRAPAAVVRHNQRDLLVGLGGELLPLDYPAGESQPLRVIRGAESGPPRQVGGGWDYGAPWPVGDVQAGIRLLRLLRTTSVWDRLAGVDVADFLRDRRLTILTKEGAEIVWGAPPGARAPGERADADKITALENLFTNPGWINAGMPRVEIYPPVILIDETASP